MKTLNFTSTDSGYQGCVMIDKIVRLSKSEDGEVTFIHLLNGEIIETSDSINTLSARIESED